MGEAVEELNRALGPHAGYATPVELTDERSAFDTWVRSWMLGEGDADRALTRNRFGDYTDEEINLKYVGWMGRSALAAHPHTGYSAVHEDKE